MDGTITKTQMTNQHQIQACNFARYIRTSIFTIFALGGQAVATLLGRLYFNEGGNSKWMATLVQTVGFPFLIPFLFFYSTKKKNSQTQENNPVQKSSSLLIVLSFYLLLGIVLTVNTTLFSIGLSYLPVSTFSLICATQLPFNAFFSYFLNAQKFTPLIINSLVVVTMSSTVLVFQNDQPESTSISSKKKYVIGFICAIAAAASCGLLLALAQYVFRKIHKTPTIRKVFELIICQCFVATCLILIGLFASHEWKSIHEEMKAYKLGKVSYVMTIVGMAVSWEISTIGGIGLIFEVSALFSNIINALGLPIVPICAVFFFHDKMNGVKVISLLLAIWGSVSYIYQHYLDELEFKKKVKDAPSADRV